jgi:hypothetical protein
MDGNGPLIKLPCACKNLPMHPGCLKEWLKVSDILTCSVCSQNISPSFIQQYVSLNDLWMYPYKSNTPVVNNINNGIRTYVGMPGIPCAELVNGKMVFETDRKRSIFLEAEKRWHIGHRLSERHKSEKLSEKSSEKLSKRRSKKHMKYKN